MSNITIKGIKEAESAHLPETQCHILPIKISENIENVRSERFNFKIDNDSGLAQAYFRGRRLTCKPLKLDDRYIGVTGAIKAVEMKSYYDYEDDEDTELGFNEEDTGPLPDESRDLHVSHTFHTMHVWGHEALPDETNDPWYAGIQNIINVAHLIHDSVE